MQKYTVNQYFVNNILNWVQEKEIAIPEIQRPFVWSSVKVRDLMDSLYRGFPIGYIIAWKNPDVRLKDGTISNGKKVLIDGQQRITALRAAILGEKIINDDYKEIRIIISFNPVTEEFSTLTPAIQKDKNWIEDISVLMNKTGGLFQDVNDYCEKNPDTDRAIVEKNIEKLLQIKNKQVGFIELDSTLDIETVTEIFIRINSAGVVLSQSDFAMSKIASYDQEDNFGVNLRKCIDYFCHISREPQFFKNIEENDLEFKNTIYFSKISWLKNENEDLYDPDYADVLRVAFTKEFERGKMADLVSLLSGRNFDTRSFEQAIMDESFQKLSKAVLEFINETHFKDFLMTIKSAGFISKNMINSQNTLNFAYIIYLKLREYGIDRDKIKRIVSRWFVMSILTGRYSGSPESKFDFDIRQIAKIGAEDFLKSIEDAELSGAFWDLGLVQDLDKSTMNNPFLNLFFAAQVKMGDLGFLSTDITVGNMISHRGDIHHLFPKEYLKNKGFSRGDYNQIANFVYAQQEINIKIGKKSPKDYMDDVVNQCKGGKLKYGGIDNMDDLNHNLKQNALPVEFLNMDIDDYEKFLIERRKLMAQKIRDYYFSL
jgi:hypothetical protein